MYLECGNYEIDSEVKKRDGHIYYVARHAFNPTKIELVFVKGKKLEGKKELVLFIEKEIINKGE